jgi:histidinol phosphatase-like PHP family hydrolase
VIDLQSHSTYSDGELPPAAVVAAAAKAGVTTLALTDHDAIDGVAEAADAARRPGSRSCPRRDLVCPRSARRHAHARLLGGHEGDCAGLRAGAQVSG